MLTSSRGWPPSPRSTPYFACPEQNKPLKGCRVGRCCHRPTTARRIIRSVSDEAISICALTLDRVRESVSTTLVNQGEGWHIERRRGQTKLSRHLAQCARGLVQAAGSAEADRCRRAIRSAGTNRRAQTGTHNSTCLRVLDRGGVCASTAAMYVRINTWDGLRRGCVDPP